MQTVTIFQKVTEVNKPYHVPVSVIVDRIRSAKDRVITDMLRMEPDPQLLCKRLEFCDRAKSRRLQKFRPL